MSMSKKDFIALADTLRPSHFEGALSETVVNDLCKFMRGQNPAFNEQRWRDYLAGDCGPSGGKIKK